MPGSLLEYGFDAGNQIRESDTYKSLPGWMTDTGPYGKSSTASSVAGITENNWLDVLFQRANSGDEAALDKLFDYLGTRASEKTANEWKAQREDTAYQRLVADLQKAGISPYVLSGATPFAANANSHTLSGSQYTSSESSKRTKQTADSNVALNIVKTILTLVGTAATISLFL